MTRVAMTMRVTEAAGYKETRDSISHDWLARLDEWGMTPLLVPNLGNKAPKALDDLGADVLVLTGGDDLGETPVRDETEALLLDHALSLEMPVFGVCRGLQLINAYFGGHLTTVEGHAATFHDVSLAGHLEEFYGPKAKVNSFHKLGIAPEGLGKSLIADAHDDTGLVEAAHHQTLPIAAVMWHPERNEALEGDRLLMIRLGKEGAFWK